MGGRMLPVSARGNEGSVGMMKRWGCPASMKGNFTYNGNPESLSVSLSLSLPLWSPLMATEDQRSDADCFQSSFRWGGGSAWYLPSLSEIRPIKLPQHRLPILPICPFTVGVLLGCSDKTGCLYIRADVLKFVFPQPAWPTVIGKETFICCGICHGNCGAILLILAYSNVFYATFYTRPQFTGGDIELCVWAGGCVHSHVPLDKGVHTVSFSVRLFIPQEIRKTVISTGVHSQLFFLSSH